MSDIRDMILNKTVGSTEQLVIEQKLNSLFYLDAKPELETEMILKQAKQDKVRVGLHASAIIAPESQFCYREQVLSLFYQMAQGENIPIGLKRIFMEGTMIGEKWQRLFLRGGLGKVEGMDMSRFVDKYDLSFTPDALLKIGKKKYVCEIKSMNTFQFKKATSHPSGRKQLKLYMYLLNCDDGFVLVQDKNNQEFKVFMEKNIPADVEPYIERLEMIQVYKKRLLEDKKMVKGICSSSTCKRAKQCNMRDACFNVGMGRIKLK